jgi:para-nitrobenzyl esterase
VRAAVALLALMTAWAAQAGPVVDTAQGRVEGVAADGIARFQGLPYAAPPVGRLRWRAPQAAAAWQGTRDASRPGAACTQKRGASLEGGGDPGPTSEDCLTLNVFTPRPERGAKLPVMVWIHGGALVIGAGQLSIYDGSVLARQGVVVVTLNYRLGPLGFLVHPALEAEHRDGAPANFGLLDQIAALRWVRANIAAFGGDPSQVTVFGESAGAQSVLALMASPPARGLFQRAVAQSAYGLPSHPRAKAREVGIKLATSLGLPGARASAAQWRALPAERFADLPDPKLTLAPSFVVGDAALPRTIVANFRAGQQAKVPLVIGSNSDEASIAAAFGLRSEAILRQLGAGKLFVQPHYPGVTDDAELGRQVVRDAVFTAYARRIAVLHAARAPTWRYYFSRLPEAAAPGTPGVMHGGEVAVVFGSGDGCNCLAAAWTEADRAASRRLVERWTTFARTGQPGPGWPRDGRLAGRVLEFGADDQVREEFMRDRLNLFISAGNLLDAALR